MARNSHNKQQHIDKPKNFKKTLGLLFKNLKGYWLQIILGLSCAAISTVLSIIGPNQIQKIGSSK